MNGAPIVLLGLGLLGGLWMAAQHLRKRPTPSLVGHLHGAFNGIAVLILAVIVWNLDARQTSLLVLGLLVLTALGGVTLAVLKARGRPWPTPLVLGHGALGLVAFVLLVVWLTGPAQGPGTDAPPPVPEEAGPLPGPAPTPPR